MMNWLIPEMYRLIGSGVGGLVIGALASHFFWQRVCPALGVLKWGQ
jgi:hypothetical protein